jgi:hypothetical protein
VLVVGRDFCLERGTPRKKKKDHRRWFFVSTFAFFGGVGRDKVFRALGLKKRKSLSRFDFLCCRWGTSVHSNSNYTRREKRALVRASNDEYSSKRTGGRSFEKRKRRGEKYRRDGFTSHPTMPQRHQKQTQRFTPGPTCRCAHRLRGPDEFVRRRRVLQRVSRDV